MSEAPHRVERDLAPRTRELVDRRELDSKSYADLLTELHGEVCTANTGAAARAAAARARWNRPVT